MRRMQVFCSIGLVVAIVMSGCARRQKGAVATPQPAPTDTAVSDTAPPPVHPTPPPPRGDQPIVDNRPSSAALTDEGIDARNLEELNRDSPLRPAFFPLDSSDLDADARTVVAANADILKRNPRWVISIEGHCDERGTAEYNLALGERRALAAKNYLLSLGIAETRVKTVSYGDEFPFDRGHTDDAWSRNRRAHFVISSK
jgi:peptidoglycan-associated lipoprotein